MAKKNGLTKRARRESDRALQAWLHDGEDTSVSLYMERVFHAGYRFGRKVERQEWHEAAGVGGSDK